MLNDYYQKLEVDNLINELNTTINNLDFTDTNETLRVNELYNNISQYLQDEDTIYDDTELRNLIQSLNNFSGSYDDLTNKPDLQIYNETTYIQTLLNDYYQKLEVDNLIQELNTTINNLDFTDTNETLRVNELYNNISQYLQDEDTIYDDTELRNLIQSLNSSLDDYNETNFIENLLLDYYSKTQTDNLIQELNTTINNLDFTDTNETLRVEELLNENQSIWNKVSSFLNYSQLLNFFYNESEIDTFLSDSYYNKIEVDIKVDELQTKDTNLNSTLVNLDDKFTNENTTIWEKLNNFLTGEELRNEFYNKSEVSESDFRTK